MDTTVRLGPLKFSLRLYIPVIILHLSNVEKKTPFYCNDHTITEFELLTAKAPLLQMLN